MRDLNWENNYYQKLMEKEKHHLPNDKLFISSLLRFKENGLPLKGSKNWEFTSLKNVFPEKFTFSESRYLEYEEIIDEKISEYQSISENILVFFNGQFLEKKSLLPSCLKVEIVDHFEKSQISHLLSKNLETSFLTNFNICLQNEFLNLKISKETEIKAPFILLSFSSGDDFSEFVSQKICLEIEENTSIELLEIFESLNEEKSYTNFPSILLLLHENSNVRHYKIQNDSKTSNHFSTLEATLKESSQLQSLNLTVGSQNTRQDIIVDLNGHQCSTNIDGLFILTENEKSDFNSVISHNVHETFSSQLFKGMVSGTSQGAFTGNIIIEQDAQKVSSSQLSKNLVLSPKAKIQARPLLEVYADDVKCSHGATIGQLNDSELFYLMTRGLPQEKAKILLCKGFATDIFNKIENKSIRDFFIKLIIKKLTKISLENNNA